MLSNELKPPQHNPLWAGTRPYATTERRAKDDSLKQVGETKPDAEGEKTSYAGRARLRVVPNDAIEARRPNKICSRS